MNGKRARLLRKAAKLFNLPNETTYNTEGRVSSWGKLPKKEVRDKNNKLVSIEVDNKLLSKLLLKTDNPKFKQVGKETYLRYSKGLSRVLAECQRSLVKTMKQEYKLA